MSIYSISDLQNIIKSHDDVNWQLYGQVVTSRFDNLLLFNYTNSCQYAGRWNYFERICRGLICDVNTGEIVARPFDKFFNWGEVINDTEMVDVVEKIDGSMGCLYRYRGEYRIATRGSFTSDQARWATEWLNKHYKLEGLDNNLTLIFEIVYPENRVVVDYQGFEGLILIGARDRFTGRELYYNEIEVIASKFGFMQPKKYSFDSINSILQAAAALSASEEGWVIRFADGGRAKVKGDAYKLAHRLMTNITFSRVLEAVAQKKFDAMIEGIPDEFLQQVRQHKADIDMVVERVKGEIYLALKDAPQVDAETKVGRKKFAQWVNENYGKNMSAYLFAARSGRDIEELILKREFEN